VRCYGMDYGSGQDLLEGSCEHGNEPWGSINFGKFLGSSSTGDLSRMAEFHEDSSVVRYVLSSTSDSMASDVRITDQ
jgi:hypothetical protein